MKYFPTSNPPKSLRISELRLPRLNWFVHNYEILVPDHYNGLEMNALRNFNKFSPSQLAEYKHFMLKNFGDIVLTLRYSDDYRAEYYPTYASNYRKRLHNSELSIARWLERYGNND